MSIYYGNYTMISFKDATQLYTNENWEHHHKIMILLTIVGDTMV